MNKQTTQPTEKRRECLILVGILCAIAYASYAVIDLASLTVRDSLSLEEMVSYYSFIRLLGSAGTVCFIVGMIALTVFKPTQPSPYFGVIGGCVYLLLQLVLVFELDITQFFGTPKSAFTIYFALSAISVILMATPVYLLKDRVVGGVRYIGMIGMTMAIELNIFSVVGDNITYFLTPGIIRNVLNTFNLVGVLSLFVFYISVLACHNKECGKRGTPYKWYEGRSCNSEYWIKVAVLTLIAVAGGVMAFSSVLDARNETYSVIGLFSGRSNNTVELRSVAYYTSMLWFLPFVLAAVPVNVRRLHDRDMSGWWLLLFMPFSLIPFVGWIVPIILFAIVGCLEGTVGPNQYGPDPKAAERERLRAMFAAQDNLVLQNNTGAVNTQIPTPTLTSEGKQPVEDRLVSLQGLKDKGLVTEEEYQAKRKEILSEV